MVNFSLRPVVHARKIVAASHFDITRCTGDVTLTDAQIDIVMNAVRDLPLEKRNTYLERVAAVLQRRAL